MIPADARKELLGRIRAANRTRGCAPSGSGAPPVDRGPSQEDWEPELFRLRLAAAGGICFSGPALDPLLPSIAEVLRADGIAALVAPEGDEGAAFAAQALAPFGPFSIRILRDDLPRRTSACQGAVAGIQTAEFAIAETGTVVQTSRGGKSLLPGLVPEIHVALVPRGALVPAMEECLKALQSDIPRNISFITGPSRTGDIEQTMTVGAHGPRKVIAVIIG